MADPGPTTAPIPVRALRRCGRRFRSMKNILLVKMSSLGDIIHNFPVATDLRRNVPEARIHWVVEEQYVSLVELHPAVDRILPFALRRWRKQFVRSGVWREFAAFRRTLREADYEAIIDTQGLLKSAWVASMARGPRYGFGAGTAREPLAARLYGTTFEFAPAVHKIQRYRAVAARALGYPIEEQFEYGIRAPADAPRVAAEPWCVIFHSTARDAKLWIESRWVEVGRALTGAGLACVLAWGSQEERARSERIAREVPGTVVAPKLSIPELAAVISRSRVVLGVDTGLMHLAAALEVPVVGVFTDSNPIDACPIGNGPTAYRGLIGVPPSVGEVLNAVREVAPELRLP